MSKHLIVVESPAKAKTITKYLGKDFRAMASYGHVRDLVPKSGAVDTERDFAMRYEPIERNKKHVDEIAKAVKSADALYLATDPDREGEAISWHLHEMLRERKVLDAKPVHRVEFYEFTKSAIQEAIAHPRDLARNLIDAQQARRALDYLVGFNISPLLWRKIGPGLSAGRVQSPALRLIVERELEIERFQAREYWTIAAALAADGKPFRARLTHFDDRKLEQFDIGDAARAHAVVAALEQAAAGALAVERVEKKQRRRYPAPPFTTSTLQQEAARKLGFSASRTMRTAQQLYEGVSLEGEVVGLISYMRTDAVNLAAEAVREIRGYIAQRYGADNLPPQPVAYKNKSKNAQEAHEAIRPTSVLRTPEEVRHALKDEQFRLYELIWKRAVACQMIHATLDTVGVDLLAGPGKRFRASGSTVVHPGFLALYEEGTDEARADEEEGRVLPPLAEGQRVPLSAVEPEQHFTEPPPRYSEASLVKALEAYGIGRPSTYAAIIQTLQAREYATLENRRFVPTDRGRAVNGFLSTHFHDYVDYDFTARMEDRLDAISRGEEEWVPMMREFWAGLSAQVTEKANVSREEASDVRVLGTDPASGRPVSARLGRFGPFVQIGLKEDAEKPRFAGLRPGQKLSTITLEEALVLFTLPRELGATPEGEKLSVNIGRFGPYVRYGSKYVSIRDDDPYTITRERALELIAAKQLADANREIRVFEGSPVRVLNGRYGPYITDGAKNARVPKERDPKLLELEECQRLLAAAPAPKPRRSTRSGGVRRKAGAKPVES
jgi:DNA topoisomerase-1